MGKKARKGRGESDLTNHYLTSEEVECFPFCFTIDDDYRRVDRLAGFSKSLGLTTNIVKRTDGKYALFLDHPEAG